MMGLPGNMARSMDRLGTATPVVRQDAPAAPAHPAPLPRAEPAGLAADLQQRITSLQTASPRHVVTLGTATLRSGLPGPAGARPPPAPLDAPSLAGDRFDARHLQGLVDSVQAGRGDRGLALDILVNLTAARDPVAEQAHAALTYLAHVVDAPTQATLTAAITGMRQLTAEGNPGRWDPVGPHAGASAGAPSRESAGARPAPVADVAALPDAVHDARSRLVHAASRNGSTAQEARAALRAEYAAPGNGEPVRAQLRADARAECEAALGGETAPVGKPLSLTVACLGLAALDAGADGILRKRLQAHIRQEVTAGGRHPSMLQEDFTNLQRMTSADELIQAGAALRHLERHPIELDMRFDRDAEPGAAPEGAELRHALCTDPLKAMKIDMERMEGRSLRTAWVGTGSAAYPHWMPVILNKDADNTVSCHVLDTNFHEGDPDKSGAAVHAQLHAILQDAGFDEAHVHSHGFAMQENVANACGPLGLWWLQEIDAALAAGLPDADGLATIIDERAAVWQSLGPEHQQAAMLATRAGMLESLVASRLAADAAPGKPEPELAGGVAMPVAAEPRTLTAHERAKLDALKEMTAAFGLSGGDIVNAVALPFRHAFSYLAVGANERQRILDGQSALDLSTLKARYERAVPEGLRPFAQALHDVQTIGQGVDFGRLVARTSLSPVTPLSALAAQIPTRLNLLMRTVVEQAAKLPPLEHVQPGDETSAVRVFKQNVDEIQAYLSRTSSHLDEVIAGLEAINKPILLADPAYRDAQRLLPSLRALRDALASSAGPALAPFCTAASESPHLAAAAIRQMTGLPLRA